MKALLTIYCVFITAFLLSSRHLKPVLSEKDLINEDGKLTLLTYGMPRDNDYQESKIAYYKYDLQYAGVAGCMISERLSDSVRHHNKFVGILMNKRFGYNWYDSLRAQAKREYIYDSTLISLVNNSDYVRERQEKLLTAGNGLHFMVDSRLGAKIREIRACGYADTSSNWVQYFLFKVNSETRKVVSFDKKAIVLE